MCGVTARGGKWTDLFWLRQRQDAATTFAPKIFIFSIAKNRGKRVAFSDLVAVETYFALRYPIPARVG